MSCFEKHLNMFENIFEVISNYMINRISLEDFPKALNIIEDVIVEFQQWLESRKFAPTIRALKTKLNELKNLELENLKKKNTNFNSKHAELISDKMIQKITNHFAYHLTNENGSASRSEELIKKVFNLEKTL